MARATHVRANWHSAEDSPQRHRDPSPASARLSSPKSGRNQNQLSQRHKAIERRPCLGSSCFAISVASCEIRPSCCRCSARRPLSGRWNPCSRTTYRAKQTQFPFPTEAQRSQRRSTIRPRSRFRLPSPCPRCLRGKESSKQTQFGERRRSPYQDHRAKQSQFARRGREAEQLVFPLFSASFVSPPARG